MEFRNYLTCLWPGLSELWWRGRLSALPLAIGFGIGLNSLLILTYFYPSWLAPLLIRSAWWVGITAWGYWVVRAVKELPALMEPRSVSDQPDRFAEAQTSYLRADWAATEPLLLGILAIEPRDPPTLLMLSGLYRHTDRVHSAAVLVDELRRLEIADGWQVEIDAEAARIARAAERSQSDGEETGEDAGDAERSEAETQPEEVSADLTAA